jgi:hypothetical protein
MQVAGKAFKELAVKALTKTTRRRIYHLSPACQYFVVKKLKKVIIPSIMCKKPNSPH